MTNKIIENSGLDSSMQQQLEAVTALADNLLNELAKIPETPEEELQRKAIEVRIEYDKYNAEKCNNC
jgi:hypothetical protein